MGQGRIHVQVNPLNTELNPVCHLLALLEAHHILHVSRIRVKSIEESNPHVCMCVCVCVIVYSLSLVSPDSHSKQLTSQTERSAMYKLMITIQHSYNWK